MVFLKVVQRSSLVTVRKHRQIMRQLHREVMVKHLRETVPQHFDERAKNVYHYERRSRKYEARKLRVKGHTRPLVWSGRTLRELKQQEGGIIATATRSRLVYRFHWQNVKAENRRKQSTFLGQMLKRKQELETFLVREHTEYARWFEQRYAEEVNKPHNQAQRRRIR